MSFIGISEKAVIQPGEFTVTVGNLSKKFVVTGDAVQPIEQTGK